MSGARPLAVFKRVHWAADETGMSSPRRTLAAALAALALAGVGAAAPGTASASPGDILVAVNKDSGDPGAIYRYDPSTGQGSIVVSGAQFDRVRDVAVAPDGAIIAITDGTPTAVLRVDPKTKKVTSILSGSSLAFLRMDIARDGGILVAGSNGNLSGVLRVDPDNGKVTTVQQLSGAVALDTGPTGRLWAATWSQVFGPDRFNVNWGPVILNGQRPQMASSVAEIAPHAQLGTRVLVAEQFQHRLIEVNADFQTTGSVVGPNPFSEIRDIARMPNGDVIVTDPKGSPKPGLVGTIWRVHRNDDFGSYSVRSVAAGPPLPGLDGVAIEPPRCGGRSATLVGSPRADVISGGKRGEVIAGLGGRDVIRGGGGNDLICGGKGRDKLLGGAGLDRHFGGAGRDACAAEGERGRDCERLTG